MPRLEEFDDAQLDVEFTQADSRSNLTSNENIAISFGKISKWYEALVPTGGSSGQFLGFNSSGTAKWVANPNTDTKVTSTLLAQSTAAATYLPTFVSAAGNSGVNIMNSFSFRHTVGTTSAVGNSRIVLGNTTASGTANNEEGQIVMYSSSTSYHTIKGSATASAVTHSLPTTGGTILNTGTTSFTQTLSSGTKIVSIKINGTSTDIYAPTNTNTTYTLTQDSTDGHKITLTPSSGTAQTVTIPDNNTTYTLSGAYGSSSNTWVTTLTPSSGTATTSTVPTASTSVYGITKLSSSTNSTSTALAATPSAVKSAYDLANGKSTVSFSASLTSGTKIGTITIDGTGTDIYCETNTNTDTKVTQTNTTTSADYRVLLSGNANDTTETTTGRKSTNLKFNPSTATLKIGDYVSGSSATKNGKLVLGNSSNVYTHTINTDSYKSRSIAVTLNDADGIMGTDVLCYTGYEGVTIDDTTVGTYSTISRLSNSVSFSGYLARFSYFTVLLCIGTDVTARTTVQVSAVTGYQSYQLIWGAAPTQGGGNLSITSGLVNITDSSGTITMSFGKCATYWQFSSSTTPTKGTTPDIHVLKVYGHCIRSNGYH